MQIAHTLSKLPLQLCRMLRMEITTTAMRVPNMLQRRNPRKRVSAMGRLKWG